MAITYYAQGYRIEAERYRMVENRQNLSKLQPCTWMVT